MTVLQVIFDTETTGADPRQADLCQLASIIMVEGDPAGAMVFNQLAKPKTRISAEAEAVHKISNEVVETASDSWHVTQAWWYEVEAYAARVNASHIVLAGHNIVNYDIPIVSRHLPEGALHRCMLVDTMRAARRMDPTADNHRLSYLAGEYHKVAGDDLLSNAHDGLADCWMVALLLDHYLKRRFPTPVGMDRDTPRTRLAAEEVPHPRGDEAGSRLLKTAEWLMAPEMLHLVPIGKHKGTQFTRLNRGSLKWFAQTEGMDPDVVYTARKLLGTYG